MRKAITILAAGGLLLLNAAAAAGEAQDVPAWPGRLGAYVFEVTRDGKPIGTQTVTLKQDGEVLTVTTESAIAVKMLGIVVYRMHQVLTDTYRGNRLVALATETKDPDGLRVGKIAREDNRWTGKNGKQSRDFECDCDVSTTMFHRDVLKGSTVIEITKGLARTVTIEDKGIETLDLPEGQVQTRHFAVKGEIARDVWYDLAGNLVAAQQEGSDGSDIRQYLLSDPQAARPISPEASEP
jgi:hypothetical protein